MAAIRELPVGRVLELTAGELVYLSALIGGQGLVGVRDPFEGLDELAVRQEVDRAQSALAVAQCIAMEPDGVILDEEIAALIAVLSFPSQTALSLLVGRTPSEEALSSAFFTRENVVVELTPSTTNPGNSAESSVRYHIRPLGEPATIARRILESWDIGGRHAAPGGRLTIPGDALREAAASAAHDARAAAAILIAAGAVEPSASAVVAALAAPRINAALLVVPAADAPVAAAAFGVLDGEDGMWRLRAVDRESGPVVELIPCDGRALATELDWFVSRAAAAAGLAGDGSGGPDPNTADPG